MSKLWGGRFSQETDQLVHKFNASLSFDKRLFHQDIDGSIAWAKGLVDAQVLATAEAEQIINGLEEIRNELAGGEFEFFPQDEDIHSAIERRLITRIGPTGGKLHTGRSRNDQVATDFRLWIMQACDEIDQWLAQLQTSLLASAREHLAIKMPGYTHLQHAQPITWSHWILAHFWPLARDRQRFKQVKQQTAVLPLGSAALAGTAYPVNRQLLADLLGFETVSQNSLDAVSSRDFVADFLYATTMIGLHLSRLAEQLIIFSSQEFGFIKLDDRFSTGSSLMPQKKNPDTLELTRGKSGRLLGNLTGFLATLKGLPSTYDKDLQEDKEPVFDAFDTLSMIIPVMAGLIESLTVQPDKMSAQLEPGLLATDVADYLVKKGMPFREAHRVVGKIVKLAEDRDKTLLELTTADYQSIHPLFEEDLMSVLSIEGAVNARGVIGGTAVSAIQKQIIAAEKSLNQQ